MKITKNVIKEMIKELVEESEFNFPGKGYWKNEQTTKGIATILDDKTAKIEGDTLFNAVTKIQKANDKDTVDLIKKFVFGKGKVSVTIGSKLLEALEANGFKYTGEKALAAEKAEAALKICTKFLAQAEAEEEKDDKKDPMKSGTMAEAIKFDKFRTERREFAKAGVAKLKDFKGSVIEKAINIVEYVEGLTAKERKDNFLFIAELAYLADRALVEKIKSAMIFRTSLEKQSVGLVNQKYKDEKKEEKLKEKNNPKPKPKAKKTSDPREGSRAGGRSNSA
jgi:hypothetical protein